MRTFIRQLVRRAVVALAVFTVLLGVVYPLATTAVAQVAFGDQADGSLVERRRRGRRQRADRPAVRVAAVLPPAAVRGRRRLRRCGELGLEPRPAERRPPRRGRATGRRLPVGQRARRAGARAGRRGDRSGSGLDPHISVANARLQARRVADARGIDVATGAELVDARHRRTGARRARRAGGQRARPQPGARRAIRPPAADRPRWTTGRLDAWSAVSSGSTSAPRPASARPSPCSTRRAGAATAAPTWWSGVVETHGRALTAAQLGDLEVVPRRNVEYRGTTLSELDVDAVLARRPDVVAIDEFAHTNAPGSPNAKRWQDVEQILAAGIDVITTVNIQHLESLNDVVAADHRHHPGRDRARPRGAGGRPDRARRHVARGAASTHGARQHLPARACRRRARELLPARQPRSAPRTRAAVGRRPRRGAPRRLPRPARPVAAPGRRASGWSSGSPGAPGADAVVRRAARIARRVGGELIGVHVVGRRRPHRHANATRSSSSSRCSSRSAARGWRWSATTR